MRWYGRTRLEDFDVVAAGRDDDAAERDRRSAARDQAGRLRDEAASVRRASAFEDEQLIRGLLLAGDRRDLAAQDRRAGPGERRWSRIHPPTDGESDLAGAFADTDLLAAAEDRARMREALTRLADLRRLETRDRGLAADDRHSAARDRAAAADDRMAAAADRDQAAIGRAQSEEDETGAVRARPQIPGA